MSDLIDRQAVLYAIDEISREVDDGYGFDYAKWREYFCELPSIQFATDTNVGTKLGTNLAEVGTDLISRQTALDICDNAIDLLKGQFGAGALVAIRESIAELPPAEPKRGKWIQDRSGAYCCSQCMEPCATYIMGKPRDKFCKMCGAKMGVTT